LITPQILLTSDAESIVNLLRHIYKEAYIVNWMYDPHAIAKAIELGRYIFVGVKYNDDLVALLTISFPDESQTAAELSTLAVLPIYRSYNNGEVVRNLISFSRNLLNNRAEQGDLSVLFSRSVTTHMLAQKLQIFLKMIPVGVTYCTRPDERSLQKSVLDKNFDLNNLNINRYDQVISMLCYTGKADIIKACFVEDDFKFIQTLFEGEKNAVYNIENLPVSTLDRVDEKIETRRSFVSFHYKYGCINSDHFLNKINYYLNKHFRVIHIYINIGEYNNIKAIERLHAFGFVYACFLPCYYGKSGHALVLQYLNGCISNSKLENIYSKKVKLLHEMLIVS